MRFRAPTTARTIAAMLALALTPAVHAQKADSTRRSITKAEFEAQLDYRRGKVQLRDGLATLDVPPEFRYLDPEQAQRILVQAWGNPPGPKPLGMLFPSNISPLSDSGWGVVIRYEEDGYVNDEGAESIDYGKLLKEMQDDARDSNEERAKDGYSTVQLIGWATPPRYDRATHKMYWAKNLKFSDNEENTLNYNTRVLGRRGVLVLNAIASMQQLPMIEHDMQQVLGFVEFNGGHRYADYVPGTDKVAKYGIGALVVGAVAAKAGFFKLLIAGLIAAKKLIIVAVAGAAAFIRRLLGKKDAPGTGSTTA